MTKINVIKVGGAIVEDEGSLRKFLKLFSALPGRKVLVHGGGRSATGMASRLGIESRMVNGRRVTDAEMLSVVTMVYGGLVNKNVVAGLQACGMNAIGLTGADMNIIRGHRRPPKEMAMPNGTQEVVDFGFVGDVDEVNGSVLRTLVEEGAIPVVAPLSHDGKGQLLNTNADTIASEVACGLSPFYDVTLTFCFEKRGVLRDANDEESVIPRISEDYFQSLVSEGVVSGGMLPKLENAFHSLHRGVKRVIITRADYPDGEGGTLITL